MDSRGPRLPGRLHRLLCEKGWLRGARLTSKHPISFKCSKVFSVFVDIMNPRPSAGFLFCCRREHRARMGVETDGCDCFRAVAGTDRAGTQTSRPFHVAATRVASGFLRSPGTLAERRGAHFLGGMGPESSGPIRTPAASRAFEKAVAPSG